MTKRAVVLSIAALLIAATAGMVAVAITTRGGAHTAHGAPAARVWTCPMHPEVRAEAPGRCPTCGMDLVEERPAAAGPAGAAAPNAQAALRPATDTVRGDVILEGRRQQLIGVRTVRARRLTLQPGIRAVGTVRYDERRQAEINLKVDGWIRELYADYTGKAIRQGDPLFTIYSPDLLATQNEYLLALKAHRQAAQSPIGDVQSYADRLLTSARQRLLLWDVPAADIARLERTGQVRDSVLFRSPVNGFIVEKTAIEGMRVMPGQMLFRIADLSNVWIEAEVFESDLAQARLGAHATVSVDALPGESFHGRVTYIHPELSAATRTGRVRVELPNPRGRLKPNMFVTASIGTPARDVLALPVDAVVDNGATRVVFVAEGDGYFTPRQVKTGGRVNGDVEILAGLVDGEEVAGSATFFIDSESQLRGALSAYAAETAGTEGGGEPARGSGGLEIAIATTPDPPRSGENVFELTARDAAGAPVTDAAASIVLYMPAMPSMNMPAMRSDVTLSHVGAGVYRGTGHVHMAGRWDVTATLLRNGQAVGRKASTLIAR
jgi:RND family efflux transporter MFP subunit